MTGITDAQTHAIVRNAFIGYLMITTSCSSADALKKMASLCAAMEQAMKQETR